MHPKNPSSLVRGSAHEIHCHDRSSLAAVYDFVAQTPWIEACDVDLPGLRLVLRLAERTRTTTDAAARWLTTVERIARGA